MTTHKMVAALTEVPIPGGLRREVRYAVDSGTEEILWWDIEGASLPSTLKRHDIVPAALIFKAMRLGVDLHVVGRVSRDLLDRLDQFQDIWSLWRSDLYKKIEVTADEETTEPRLDPARLDAAVCAFSGGVDATATIWRHRQKLAGRVSRRLHCGVLIRGFDLPLDNDQAWGVACKSASAALDDIDVPFVRVATNWKRDVCTNWEMEYVAGVLAVLRHWDEDVGTLLLASAEDYNRLVTPLGSHPFPTQLLAGQDSTAKYDGGDMTRTAKVGMISRWPTGYNSLRVCWQGAMTGYNCGKCEKCIRTKLNAIASNSPLPRSLDGPLERGDILGIKEYGAGQRPLMEEIVAVAAQNNVSSPLIEAAQTSLTRADWRSKIRRIRRGVKKSLGLEGVRLSGLGGALRGRLFGAKSSLL
jgi:hypothetical protein